MRHQARNPVKPCFRLFYQYFFTQNSEALNQPATIEFNFGAHYFSRKEIIALQSRLSRLTAFAANNPPALLESAPILPQAEYERLKEFNATAAAFPRKALVHQLFEQQVAATRHGTGVPCRVAMNAGIVFDAFVKCWLRLLSGDALVIEILPVQAATFADLLIIVIPLTGESILWHQRCFSVGDRYTAFRPLLTALSTP